MRRTLNLFDVTCIGLNAIVGSGIFLLPDDLYREMGSLSPLAFLICALGLLPVALCYAEAASRTDRTGGPYVYSSMAFGPRVGFAVGWLCITNALFSFAAVASAAAAYLTPFFPNLAGSATQKTAALAIIFVFAALNYRGAKPGALAIDIFTIAKFGALLTLIAALLPLATTLHLSADLPQGAAGVGRAVFMAFFAAQGFEVTPVPAGETVAPKRNMPLAVCGSLLLASLLYLAVQTVLVCIPGSLDEVSDTPLSVAALRVAPALALVVTSGGLISTLGFVSGSALGAPRYVYAAAADRRLPQSLARVHRLYASPHRAIVAAALLAAALTVPFDYRQLIGISNVSVAMQFLLTCAAVLKLRTSTLPAPSFRAPGGPFTPIAGMFVSLWVFTEASQSEVVTALSAVAVGAMIDRAMRRARREAGVRED